MCLACTCQPLLPPFKPCQHGAHALPSHLQSPTLQYPIIQSKFAYMEEKHKREPSIKREREGHSAILAESLPKGKEREGMEKRKKKIREEGEKEEEK
jgi:hypothetical protein